MVEHAPMLLPSKALPRPAPFQLLPKPRGALHNLVPEPLETHLATDQVLLEVHAVGVNFRDVLNVLGMYPGDPGHPWADCAGVVIAKGTAVTQLAVGRHPILFQIRCCFVCLHVAKASKTKQSHAFGQNQASPFTRTNSFSSLMV